jgi:Holliday junction resolvase RusA-like endonuclease
VAFWRERRVAVRIPGKPQPQGRARGRVRFRTEVDPTTQRSVARGFVAMRDPATSAAWKNAAGWLLASAMRVEARARGERGLDAGAPLTGPLAAHVRAVFPRATRDGVGPRAWNTKAQGDVDNVAKAVLDAANGIGFIDDRQVARLVVEKVVAAAGEEPHVSLAIASLGAIEPPH